MYIKILRLERYLYSCASIVHRPFNLKCLFKFATNGVIGGTSSREALQKKKKKWKSDTNTSCHEWTSLTGESKRKVTNTLDISNIHHTCTLCIPAASFIDERHPSA